MTGAARVLSPVSVLLLPALVPASPLGMSCLGCHQPRTHTTTMPALAGRSAQDIAAYLKAARDTPTAGSIMARFAAGLDDAQIDALARELGRMP